MQTDARAPRDDGPTTAPAGWLVVVMVAGLVVPLAVAAHYHALGIPRSDDWSYLVTEFRWIDTGHLSFNHWVSMSLVGQLALAAPIAALLPRDIRALQVLTAVLGSVGLGAVWWAARRIGITPARAALVAATIAAGPLWGPLSASFMTDVPTFAFSSVAVALALVGVTRNPVRLGWVWAAVAAAVVACTIRQYAVVTLAAVVLAAWYSVGSDRARRRAVVEVAVVAIAVVAIFLLWWRTVPDGRSLSPGLPDVHAVSVFVSKGAGFIRLAGLLLLPVLVAARPVARLRTAWRETPAATLIAGGGSATWLAVAAARAASDVFVGNYVEHDGALSTIVVRGPRPDLFPGPVWVVIALVASIAGVVLTVLATHACVSSVRSRRAPGRKPVDPVTVLLGTTVVGYLAGYAVAMLAGIQVYDRYILPLLPAAAMLLLRSPVPAPAPDPGSGASRRAAFGSVVALVALAAVGLAFAADSASFDGARWRVAQDAVARGWPVARVTGDFEWRAFRLGDRYAPRRRLAPCVAVKIDPSVRPDRIVAVVRSSAPTRATMRIVAFRTRADCPVPGPAVGRAP